MTKIENWDIDLFKYAHSIRSKTIDYDTLDCILMASKAVEIQTGVDLAEEHFGKYKGKKQAYEYMKSQGWEDVDDVVGEFLEEIEVNQSCRGDILMFDGEYGKSIGVCLGLNALILTNDGARTFKSSKAVKSWRVG